MAQETTPNYPAMREVADKAKLDASAKRIQRADRASEQRAKKTKEVEGKAPVATYIPIEFDVKPAVPLQRDPDSQSDSYNKRGPVKYVDQAPRPVVEQKEVRPEFTMDNLRRDLSILGPLVEQFKAKYLYAMGVVIRTEDPNYDQSKTLEDPKLEKAAELAESMGRKEGEVRNSSQFAKELFGKIDESLKQELIKLGIVGEGEGNVDKLLERTSKYVEKAKAIVEIDDKNKELEGIEDKKAADVFELNRTNPDKVASKTQEIQEAEAELKRFEDAVNLLSGGDMEKRNTALDLAAERIQEAKDKIERLKDGKAFLEKEVPMPNRDKTVEVVAANNKRNEKLIKDLTSDATQYNKYHVKNPDASWDSESKKVKVEEAKTTEPLTVSELVTASVDGGPKTTLNEPVMGTALPAVETAADVEVNEAMVQLDSLYEANGYVGNETVTFSAETTKAEDICYVVNNLLSSIESDNALIKALDQEIAQKGNTSGSTLGELDDPEDGGTVDSALNVLNIASTAEPTTESDEIKVLVGKREALLRRIATSKTLIKEVFERNNIPEDKQSEFLELGKQLELATSLTLRANKKIAFANAELSKPDSELAKKLGLEGKDELKAKLLARLQKDKETAFASVKELTAKMNLIMGVTTTESAPDNGTSGPLSIGGSVVSGGTSAGAVVNAQVIVPNEGGNVVETPKVVVPEKGRLAKYWDSVKSFIDKTVGKDAPKGQRVSIFVAVGLIAAVLFGTRGFGAVKLAEDLVRKGPDQANKGPNPDPTKTGPLVSPLGTPTPTATPGVVKDGNVTSVVPLIQASVDFTQTLADVAGAPDVFINPTNPSWSQATPTPVPAASPSSVSAVVGEAPKISVAKLVPVELKEGDSLSAKYHENGYFTEVTNWSHENAMPMVIQMVTDNIKNPEFWNRMFENSPELKANTQFQAAVKRAQAANYSPSDEKAIKELLSQHFKFNNLTAEELADKLGFNKLPVKGKWNIPVKE